VARLVVIGGGAAGMSAASAARRVAPELDVAVFEADGFAAYGMCGIPYLLGGIVPRAEDLLAYPPSEFRDHRGIDLRLGCRVSAIDASAHQVHVAGSGPVGYDTLVVAAGASPVRPPVPGLDRPGVDCVALRHLVLDAPAWVPLGPAANKTGRVAGTVASGGTAAFPGIVGTAVVKVFDLEVARTGLTLAEARAAGLAATATDVVSRSRAKYYPGGSPLHVRLVHTPDGRLLGGQLAGREGAAKRVDVLATALSARFTVSDLAGLDLSYAPPFAPVYDPVLAAAIKADHAAHAAPATPATLTASATLTTSTTPATPVTTGRAAPGGSA